MMNGKRHILVNALFLLVLAVGIAGCSKSTNSNVPIDESPRERIEVSGSIAEDSVWETGKEYYVTGDVTVSEGVTLTIEPDVRVLFKADAEEDYYGLTVKGTLIADGEDSTTAILFTSDAPEWARKPGDWTGIDSEDVVVYSMEECGRDVA